MDCSSKKGKSCEQEKPLTAEFWSPQKAGKFGFTSRCRVCKLAEWNVIRARPDQVQRQKAWRDGNKKYIKDYNAAYRAAGYSSTADAAAWRVKNLEWARACDREKQRKRYQTIPWVNLKSRVTSRLQMMLRGKKSKRTEEILGYSIHELVTHIERQFTKGMSWDRLLNGEIHIDHIIPVAKFRPETEDDPAFKACWALSNLRPLWAFDNKSKGARLLTLL